MTELELVCNELRNVLGDIRHSLEREDADALEDGQIRGEIAFDIEVKDEHNHDVGALVEALKQVEQNFRPQIGYECQVCGEFRLLKKPTDLPSADAP